MIATWLVGYIFITVGVSDHPLLEVARIFTFLIVPRTGKKFGLCLWGLEIIK